jgi:hypothetical protein
MPRPAALEWLCLVGGLLLTIQYAWILDDAFVYFRYVDNWVLAGVGLVYNRGEYVEGFTSPLWVGVLGALRAAGVDYWDGVRALGLAAFGGFWALTVALNRRLAPPGAPVVNLPLLVLSFHYGVLCYFTSGTEAPLVLLLAPLFALFVLSPGSLALELGVALAPLVRPELGLAWVAALGWSAWRRRRAPWRLLLLGALFGGAWLAFRIVYYADFAPNTYHLKAGTDWAQGLAYLADTLRPYHLLPIAGLAALALAAGSGSRHLAERGMACGIAVAVALYVVKVGGDARHFRYLAFPFTLVVLALGGSAERALRALPRGAGIAIGAALALLALSLHPRQLGAHPLRGGGELRMLDGIGDAQHYRTHWAIPRLDPWGSGDPIDVGDRYTAAGHAAQHSGSAVGYVCWKLYAAPERRAIHALGLTEAYLAQVEMPAERPGHKWGLMRLARDIERVQRWWARAPEPGMYRAALGAGVAPEWMGRNLARLEWIERKVHNRHHPLENLALALTSPGRIQPPAEPEEAAAPGALPRPEASPRAGASPSRPPPTRAPRPAPRGRARARGAARRAPAARWRPRGRPRRPR